MGLNYKKAFEYIKWKFLTKTIAHYNYGPSFKRWINIVYAKVTVA